MVLDIISNLEMIQSMCVGQMQMRCHFIYGTRAFMDFGVCGSPIPRKEVLRGILGSVEVLKDY